MILSVDGNGNLTTKTGLYGEYTYGYDSLNRLTNECFEKSQTANAITTENYRTGYTYDYAGNRLSMEKNGILTEYTYDSCNRLMSEKTGEMTRNFTYDVCGNLSHDGTMTYTYDELNRLAEIMTQDGHVQKHRYDAEGLRHELEEDGKLVQFLYNHKQEVIVEESKEEGLKRYIRGLGLISSDCEQSKTYYHYVSDNVGSITHVLNENAETENEYQYDAFGNTIGCYENVVNRFRYAGEQYDAVTSQYYLRARYYNPVIGRFTQQDTYLGAGLNLYAYCDNNPLSYIDPSGHNPESAAGRQDILPSNILEIPSVQRMMDSYRSAENGAVDTYSGAAGKYIDTSVQSQSNAIYGDATSGADAGTLAPAPSSTESAPIPTTPQSTALVPVAPMGSYPLVPVAPMGTYQLAPVAPMGSYPIVPYNANSNNPLITRQSADVSSAVNDAGGRTDRRPLMPMNLQFFAESGKGSVGRMDLAGKTHPVSGVKFDSNGFPIFDSKYNTTLDPQDYMKSRSTHFDRASKALYKDIMNDSNLRSKFTEAEIAIFKDGGVPKAYTWHHHQDAGVMQLVDRKTHRQTGHTGGFSIWGPGN